MYTNVNLSAPIGALAFLGAGFLFCVAAVALVYSIIKRKFVLTRAAVVAMAAIAVMYLSLLLVFSFRSSDKLLARGEEKYFCEIDCHLAYSITDVRETKALEDAFNPADEFNRVTAKGMFRLVTIQTRFDENTISRTRGNQPLTPNSRVVYVLDEQGNRYFPSSEAQLVLVRSQDPGKPLSAPLRPGETYTSLLVFDLPTDVRNPTLLMQEGHLVTSLLIGHENSPFHKKARFQL